MLLQISVVLAYLLFNEIVMLIVAGELRAALCGSHSLLGHAICFNNCIIEFDLRHIFTHRNIFNFLYHDDRYWGVYGFFYVRLYRPSLISKFFVSQEV